MTPPDLTDQRHDACIERAAQRLLAGDLVAFPTETVYGLGADAENPAAIARIYAAKQRPAGHPLIVHLAPGADLAYWTGSVSPYVQALADAFWPGPLTLILPRATHIPSAVSGGQPTLGLRCPSHPVAQALLSRFAELKSNKQGGVAAPSANKFGQVSPTCAEHVRNEFPELSEAELLILDGGRSAVGIESTIVDVSDDRPGAVPTILRPGHILPEQIAKVLGVMPGRTHAASPQVSGSLKAHYAPRTPLRLVRTDDLPGVIETITDRMAPQSPLQEQGRVAVLAFRPPACAEQRTTGQVDYYQCESDAMGYARELYDIFRRLDQKGYTALLIEQPPQTPEWHAVNDRLGRAAAAFDS